MFWLPLGFNLLERLATVKPASFCVPGPDSVHSGWLRCHHGEQLVIQGGYAEVPRNPVEDPKALSPGHAVLRNGMTFLNSVANFFSHV
jgi:hypothetical protein